MVGRAVCAMGFEPVLLVGRPCDLSGFRFERESVGVVCPLVLPVCSGEVMEV